MLHATTDTADLAHAEMARLCGHKLFRKSEVLPRMLAYLLEAELNGRVATENQMAQEFLGLSEEEFHPYSNSYIRVNMSQVRKRLVAYYREAPPGRVRFHLPQGSFRLRIELPSESTDAWRRAWAQAKLLSASRYVDELDTALQRIDQVLAEKPDFALAYALKSHCYLLSGSHGGDPVASALLARPAAVRAMELAPDSWESLAAAASVAALLDFEWATALSLYDRAARVPGNEVWADPWYQATLVALNQFDLCLDQMSRALNDYPLPPRSLQQNYGATLHLAGRFEEAERELLQTSEILPDDFGSWFWRAIQALTHDRRALAIQFLARGAIVSRGRMPGTVIQAGRDFFLTGKFKAPETHAGGVVECGQLLTLGVKRSEAAIDAMERMVTARNAIAGVYIRLPLLGYLHSNTRFLALFDRMGIPRPVAALAI